MDAVAVDADQVKAISDQDKVQYQKHVKVFLAQPTQGLIHHWAKDNYVELAAHLKSIEQDSDLKFFHGDVGRLAPGHAREILAERAIQAGMDYILWIDDDMVVPLNLFEMLYSHGKDLVAALAFMRVPPFNPVMWYGKDDNGYSTFDQINDYPDDGSLFKVDAFGFGTCLTKTTIFEKIPKPWFLCNMPIAEDILFTYKCKMNGIQPYVDLSCKVQHIGPPILVGEGQYREYTETGALTLKYGGHSVKREEKVIGEVPND